MKLKILLLLLILTACTQQYTSKNKDSHSDTTDFRQIVSSADCNGLEPTQYVSCIHQAANNTKNGSICHLITIVGTQIAILGDLDECYSDIMDATDSADFCYDTKDAEIMDECLQIAENHYWIAMPRGAEKCKLFPEGTVKDDCFSLEANSNHDITICNYIVNKSDSVACQSSIIEQLIDQKVKNKSSAPAGSVCKLITDSDASAICYDKLEVWPAILSQLNARNEQFCAGSSNCESPVIQTNDSGKACESLNTTFMKNECYYEYAIAHLYTDGCERSRRDNFCSNWPSFYRAVSSNYIELCQKTNNSDLCYSEAAEIIRDATVCEKVQKKDLFEQCKSNAISIKCIYDGLKDGKCHYQNYKGMITRVECTPEC